MYSIVYNQFACVYFLWFYDMYCCTRQQVHQFGYATHKLEPNIAASCNFQVDNKERKQQVLLSVAQA